MLRKSHPNFQHYVKKIKAQAKKWFSYKKVQSEYLFCEGGKIPLLSLNELGEMWRKIMDKKCCVYSCDTAIQV